MVFTFAPSNPMLLGMKAVGRLFPRANRAPWIEPVAESTLRRMLNAATRACKPGNPAARSV
jgi:magnesium-protoporphyrin O-methyltransferase